MLSLKTRHSLSTCQPLSTNFPALWLTLSRGFATPYPLNIPRVPGGFRRQNGATLLVAEIVAAPEQPHLSFRLESEAGELTPAFLAKNCV